MTFFAEIVRQIGLLLVGWTVVSVVAVWPVAWWMRRRAALNEGDLALLAGRPGGPAAALSAAARRSITHAR
jgi:hypothetical protein